MPLMLYLWWVAGTENVKMNTTSFSRKTQPNKTKTMKQYTKEEIEKIMLGCQSDNYNSVVTASRIICRFVEGNADIDCDPVMKPLMKISLWRKFMRAYSRFVRNNPQAIMNISIDCFFSSIVGGERKGIEETIQKQ